MRKKNQGIRKYIFIAAVFFFLFSSLQAHARNEYAQKTGKGCNFCHQQEVDGPLKITGIAYIKNSYQYPIPNRILKKAELHQNSFHKTLRFIIGYIHILAAFILIGVIFYIHIFIKPSQITGGLPRGERILGLSCLCTLALTGIYLTWFRIDSFISWRMLKQFSSKEKVRFIITFPEKVYIRMNSFQAVISAAEL